MRDPLRSAGPVRLLVVVAVAGLAAIGLWWVLTTPLSGDGSQVERSGSSDAFYRLGAPTEGLAVGQVAPELAGEPGTDRVAVDLEGHEVTLASLRGRPVWVVFWATWCPPCQAETPDLRRAYEAHASDGLALIAIDVQEPAEVVADYVERYGLTYTAALDPTGEIDAPLRGVRAADPLLHRQRGCHP